MKKLKSLLAVVLMTGILTGCNQTNSKEVETIITLDINPSIQLHLDKDNNVMSYEAGNDDGKVIVDQLDNDEDDVDQAINDIIDILVAKGYLTSDHNTVLLSVNNDDEETRIKLEDEFGKTIQDSLKGQSIDGAIYVQDGDIDDDIEELMKKYDISYGKASLIDKIMDDSDDNSKSYLVEDLVKLNAQELIMIYQSMENRDHDDKMMGTVSTTQYIPREHALQVALDDAGLTQSQITDLEIDYDIENGVLTYEVEFKANGKEYEYEISAIQGIIEREVENTDDSYVAPQTTQPVTPQSDDSGYDESPYQNNDNSPYETDDSPYANDTSTNLSDDSGYDDSGYDDTDDDDSLYDD